MQQLRPVMWARRHPLATDSLLAVAVTAMAVGGMWGRFERTIGSPDPTWWSTLLAVGASMPVALRRRSPIGVLAVVTACQFSLDVIGFDNSGWLPLFIGVYTVAAHTGGPTRAIAIRTFFAATAVLVIGGLFGGDVSVGDALSGVVFMLGAYLIGDNLRRRRQASAEAAERAAIDARQLDLLRHREVQDERTRIARELHDVVAHSVSLMIIQAGAARRSIAAAPEDAETTLRNLEDTGRNAMDELRRVLGVLRSPSSDGSELAPQPTMSDIRQLAHADPSFAVDYVETGAAQEVPVAVGLSMYRLVQEALTNVRKHAGAVRRVVVQVDYEPTEVKVSVSDDGRGASAALTSTDAGHGLVGMRERMAICGGSVRVGPRPGGGWHVRARAPIGTSAAAATAAFTLAPTPPPSVTATVAGS